MKFCKDCAHGALERRAMGMSLASTWDRICDRRLAKIVDLVEGAKTKKVGRWCSDERKRGRFRDTCGPDGKYWQAKGEE